MYIYRYKEIKLWDEEIIDFSLKLPEDSTPKPIDLPVVISYVVGNIQDLLQTTNETETD